MYKHDAIVRAWLDGKTIQARRIGTSVATYTWSDVFPTHNASYVPNFSVEWEFRIKPETVRYRLYLWLRYDHLLIVETCHDSSKTQSPEELQKCSSFVRWIDTDWQEVEV